MATIKATVQEYIEILEERNLDLCARFKEVTNENKVHVRRWVVAENIAAKNGFVTESDMNFIVLENPFGHRQIGLWGMMAEKHRCEERAADSRIAVLEAQVKLRDDAIEWLSKQADIIVTALYDPYEECKHVGYTVQREYHNEQDVLCYDDVVGEHDTATDALLAAHRASQRNESEADHLAARSGNQPDGKAHQANATVGPTHNVTGRPGDKLPGVGNCVDSTEPACPVDAGQTFETHEYREVENGQ